ncbi:MAG: bile acid:sodium symporter family protein [Saprospiraceae bacterium]
MSPTDIDQIKIAFSGDQLWILNIVLGILMFNVALDIDIKDFKRILKKPKSFIVGISFQLLILPALSVILIHLIQPAPSIALGMLLVAVCPGGNLSNYMVYLAKGNAALSILMTSTTTLVAIVFTPFAFSFWSGFLPETASMMQTLKLNVLDVVKVLTLIILVPLFLGMYLKRTKPGFSEWLQSYLSKISLVLFFGFVFVAIWGNRNYLGDYLKIIFWIVLIQNTMAFLLGFSAGKLFRLPLEDTKALTIESGVHNSGLGLFLIITFFGGLGGMMLVAAWWGIWHLIAGFFIARIFARLPKKPETIQ